jgi:hypothetical protein
MPRVISEPLLDDEAADRTTAAIPRELEADAIGNVFS